MELTLPWVQLWGQHPIAARRLGCYFLAIAWVAELHTEQLPADDCDGHPEPHIRWRFHCATPHPTPTSPTHARLPGRLPARTHACRARAVCAVAIDHRAMPLLAKSFSAGLKKCLGLNKRPPSAVNCWVTLATYLPSP